MLGERAWNDHYYSNIRFPMEQGALAAEGAYGIPPDLALMFGNYYFK